MRGPGQTTSWPTENLKTSKTTSPKIRVLVVDDHPVVRRGLLTCLAGRPSLTVAGEAADGEEALQRVAELHTERRELLTDIIVREMGKPVEQALGEVDFSAAIYSYYAENGEKFLADEPIELLDGEGSAFVRRSSLGVLLGIMPWNFPYYQVRSE